MPTIFNTWDMSPGRQIFTTNNTRTTSSSTYWHGRQLDATNIGNGQIHLRLHGHNGNRIETIADGNHITEMLDGIEHEIEQDEFQTQVQIQQRAAATQQRYAQEMGVWTQCYGTTTVSSLNPLYGQSVNTSSQTQQEWSKQEMKNIKDETVRKLKILKRSDHATNLGRNVIPNESFVYELEIRKDRPTGDYLIVPDDMLEIRGTLNVLSSTEEYQAGYRLDWKQEGNDWALNIKNSELSLTHTAMAKDFASLLKKAGFKGDIVIRDAKAEKKEYEKQRAIIREEIRAERPDLDRYDLRYATDDRMRNHEEIKINTRLVRVA